MEFNAVNVPLHFNCNKKCCCCCSCTILCLLIVVAVMAVVAVAVISQNSDICKKVLPKICDPVPTTTYRPATTTRWRWWPPERYPYNPEFPPNQGFYD